MSWNKWKTMSAIVTIFFQLPIWFFILYSILKATNQDRLVWFLFWAYIPITILLHILIEVGKRGDE